VISFSWVSPKDAFSGADASFPGRYVASITRPNTFRLFFRQSVERSYRPTSSGSVETGCRSTPRR